MTAMRYADRICAVKNTAEADEEAMLKQLQAELAM